MDDKTTPPSNAAPPAARTAEALRELQERTRAALAAQRARMGELEGQLTAQLDSIAGALAEQLTSPTATSAEVDRANSEAESLRRELEAVKAVMSAESDRLSDDVATHAKEIDDRQAALEARETVVSLRSEEVEAQASQMDAARAELATRQQVLDDRAAELNYRDRELRQRQELLDSYAAQSAALQSQLAESRQKLEQDSESLATRQSELRASQALVEHHREEFAEREKACERDDSAVKSSRAALEIERETLASQEAQLKSDQEALAAQQEIFAAQRAERASADESAAEDLIERLAKAEHDLIIERESWEKEFAAVRADRRALEAERDELSSAFSAVSAELKSARADVGAADERNELRQKFELALEDVQRLRARIAELEQDLATRPAAADDTDSVELVHLRSERDALAERVAELERHAATPVDGDASQERAELQRRFELAVDDVRDLKKKNSQLEAQLADARSRGGTPPAASSDSANSSWELMKKKMLANLEGEIDDVEQIDTDRLKERATIENTISITDEVVANKDREIAELKSQLASGSANAAEAAELDQVRELVDSDEIIRQHRERIAKLELEMESKLRAAELEISVERAKIARDQSHLADLRAELESQRAQGPVASVVPGHPPKRRWLSKLGLSGDEE